MKNEVPCQGHANQQHRSLCDVFEPIKIITFKLFPQKSSLLLFNCFLCACVCVCLNVSQFSWQTQRGKDRCL